MNEYITVSHDPQDKFHPTNDPTVLKRIIGGEVKTNYLGEVVSRGEKYTVLEQINSEPLFSPELIIMRQTDDEGTLNYQPVEDDKILIRAARCFLKCNSKRQNKKENEDLTRVIQNLKNINATYSP